MATARSLAFSCFCSVFVFVTGFSSAWGSIYDGLVAHYPFDGSLSEASGRHSDGEWVGTAKYTEDAIVGKALSHNSQDNNYVAIPMSSELSGQGSDKFSVSVWINASVPNKGVVSGRPFWLLHWSSSALPSRMRFYIGSEGRWKGAATSESAVGPGWHHFVGVYDGGAISLYIDGVLDVSIPASGPIGNSTDGDPEWITIGKDYYHTYSGYGQRKANNADIDELRIYNTALTATAVAALYNQEKEGVTESRLHDGLVAHYQFEGNADDVSGFNNDGSISGVSSYAMGKQGQAFVFNGATSITVPSADSLIIDEQITISAWVKQGIDSPDHACLVEKGQSNVIWDYGLCHFASFPTYRNSSSDWTRSDSDQDFRDDWHHFAAVVDESSVEPVRLYVDGVEINGEIRKYWGETYNESYSRDGLPQKLIEQSSYPLTLGKGHPGVYFVGAIDNLRIYNRSLSEQEIFQLYRVSGSAQVREAPPATINSSTPSQSTNTEGELTNGCNCIEGSPGPVLVNSGNYVHTHNDLSIRSLGLPLSVTRYYNSQDLYDGPFGHGWNMEYTARLVLTLDEAGNETATIHLGNGVRRKFTKQTNGTYLAPSGQDDTLYQRTDGVFVFNGECGTGCEPKPRTAYEFQNDGSGDYRLIAQVDRNGNRVTIGYDGFGRILSATDANDRAITFGYGDNGRVATISDFSTVPRVWNYDYDAADNLVSVTDPLNNQIQYLYDDKHNLIGVKNARGELVSSVSYGSDDKVQSFTDNGGSYGVDYDPVSQVTRKTNPAQGLFSFNYDSNGNITQKTDPQGNTQQLSWDSNVDLTGRTNALGVTTGYRYDAYHRVTQVILDEGTGKENITTAYSYDPVTGQVASVTDPLGQVSSFTYDARGNQLTRTTPLGTTTNTYDASGNLTSVTAPSGVVTRLEYDANGYPTRQYIDGSTPLIQTTYSYDERGNRLTQSDPNGNTTQYAYDELDRLTAVTNALGEVTQYSYDVDGNLVFTTDPVGTQSQFVYDQYDRVIERIDALGTALQRSTTYSYDSRGNLLSQTSPLGVVTQYRYDEKSQLLGVDTLGLATPVSWNFSYDALGNRIAQADPNGNTTSYGYDALNRLASVTDAEGQITRYTYDKLNRLLTVTDANGNTATNNSYAIDGSSSGSSDALGFTTTQNYDAAGRLTSRVDANGNTVTHSYDSVTGRLASIQYSPTRTETFNYDTAGNLLSVTDSETGVSVSYTYDARNRLQSETQQGITLTYGYDARGLKTQLSSTLTGAFGYGYDALGRLVSILSPSGETTRFSYDAGDRQTEVVYGETGSETPTYKARTQYSYDVLGRVLAIRHEKADGAEIETFAYGYDNLNNRLSETNASGTISYSYDKTYKLLSASYPDGETISFTYDGTGNRLSKTDNSGATNYSYDVANRLVQVTSPTEVVDYSYDNNGNLLSLTPALTGATPTRTMEYDEKNQLIRLRRPTLIENDLTVEYQYDPLGRRVLSRTDMLGITEQRYIHDGQNPLADLDANLALQTLYTPALGLDQLASQTQEGSSRYYLRDALNSVRLVLNGDQSVAARYDYQPYGAIRSQTGSVANRFTYTGRSAEPVAGLMYYRSRYYDTAIGRFLKKDSYNGRINEPLSLHRYGYVHGNPVNDLDPTGYLSERSKSLLTATGAITLGVIGVVGVALSAPVTVPAMVGATLVASLSFGGITYGGIQAITAIGAKSDEEAGAYADQIGEASRIGTKTGLITYGISNAGLGNSHQDAARHAGYASVVEKALAGFATAGNSLNMAATSADMYLSMPSVSKNLSSSNSYADAYMNGYQGTVVPPFVSCDQ